MSKQINYTAQEEKQMIKAGIKLLKANRCQIEFLFKKFCEDEAMKLMYKITRIHFPNVRFVVREEMVFQFIDKYLFSN